MKLSLRFILAGAFVLAVVGCGGDDSEDNAAAAAPREFWGPIASNPALVSLRFEDGQQVSVFVTDGFPNGLSEFFRGPAPGNAFNLTSTSGAAQIQGTIQGSDGLGTVRLPDGTLHNFSLIGVRLGAGRYDVTITPEGAWSGVGPDGNTLAAQQQGDLVTGAITTGSGERFDYRLHDLSRTLAFGAPAGQPDDYTVFVAPRASVQLGRGGGPGVAAGTPGANFVNLDLPLTPEILPGIFFGRVRFDTDLLLIDVNEPAAAGGPRSVRAYVSDGEPEPEGDIEWFQGTFTGNSFQLTSASGGAVIDATISDVGASGTIAYGSGPARPFFAGPAGEGAGIYDVTVDQTNRLRGTSEEGGVLDLVRDGVDVDGAVTTPAGTVLPVRIHDVVRGLRYPGFEEIATVADTYVAFISPRARWVVGRSGNVRGGSAGLNIIGLDKACASPR